MGNTESHSSGHGYYGDGRRHLSRKHMSRSLRLSSKQTYCSRRTPSGKPEHRNSETSTRSSSTPSIPQSLADHGLEPFNDSDMLPDFSSPIWVDRVAMNLRPMSFHSHPAHSPAATHTAKQAMQDDAEPPEDKSHVQRTQDGSQEASSFKKKRSKSADMWREGSLEVSLSDLSQEHLTSTEEIGDTPDTCEASLQSSVQELLDSNRANSLDELYGPKSPACRPTHGRYAKWHKGGATSREGDEDKIISPCEDDGAAYGAYTLPCRRSHCLSEGPTNHQGVMQGRRAQTIQDVTAGDGSDYEDSGIDGLTGDREASQHHARRYKTMSASFSAYSTSAGGAFAGSDSGSSSGAGAGPSDDTQGVYENFRQELEQSVSPAEVPEERSSAFSDEQSSVTLSSAYHTDPLLNVAAVQGTVRKAGRLAVKNFLVHKKNKKVELAPRRKWKSYWVSLKGCTLFFYETDGRSGIDHNSVPKHAVWAENSIVQAVPEHPKKDFVFCLSNSLGDSFLFQTCSQTELENWITAIHSACAAAVARQHHREDTVRLLRAEIRKLEQKIDMDEKMKKMGDMQLSAVTDAKKRKTILEQIFLWEQNLEQFHMDLFRFRCYLSSLQGGELPNPKRLLAFASRPTKLAMGRLGIFSVSSFHALVAARTESGVRRRTQAMSRSTSKRKSRFSSLWGLDTHSKRKSKGHPSISQVFAEGDDQVKSPLEGMFEGSSCETTKDTKTPVKGLPRPSADHDIWSRDHLTPSWVLLPNDQPVLAIIQPGESALDMLETICKAHQLDPTKHYVRLKFLIENQVQFYIPKPEEDIYDLLYKEIELCCKIRKVIQFDRDESCMIGYGFSISVVEEDGVQQLYITDVRAGGLAFAKGLNAGDEILQLNRKDACTLTFADMKVAFAQVSLSLTVNTLPPVDRRQLCFLPPRRSDAVDNVYTDIFSQSQEEILDDGVGLIVETFGDSLDDDLELFTEFDDYGKSTEQVAAFCRSLHEMNPSSEVVSSSSGPESSSLPPSNATPRQLSDADKLRKVICELVETERTYVKDLNCLIGRYLTPLQKESFLTQDELDVLFGNLPEMLEFQVEFLKTLEDGTRLVPDLEKLERVEEFKKILFSLGGSFLYYADRFKIYSAFCASHTKVPKVLVKAKTDVAFKAFLDERNPKQQHSSTLESYLIKPIQRVLKYPLLLRELHSLTDPDSEEHYHLNVAMKAMNTVASHINEMQKIHEEFGAVFDLLISEQTGDKKEVADLSMGDLLLHTSVTWINPSSSLGKCKKEPQLATFVFKTAVVFICKDYSKQKKKMGGSHRASVSGEEKDPFRFRHMIPTDALQVRTLSNTDGESAAVCEIIHVKSESEGRPERVFQLCCSSPESKKDFLKTVHSILRDKQRRQLLKTESLPLSQQYVPFGGKRLCALKGARPAMNRAVSAPTRTLGRRKLVRNRFTIDTDIVFDTEPDSDSPDSQHAQQQGVVPAGDTDRWVEEQFDLQCYEEQEQDVKETDILSDDDEFCQSALSPSTEPDVEGPLSALSLEGDTAEEEEEEEEESKKDYKSQHAKLSHLGKQCAMSVASVDEQVPDEDIWVRRDSSTENETQDETQS
ncbi:T-lymphoma invasion and metastasis-inducing protein 1-like [Sinocyclocheilus rhinocerous]|uniref:T-lymphoma invasion and metastasis-inducing protein 1-like n=1 Tax=Sinocyclocheilus rhinocerous TaxID=307959 RepID=UPI0007BAA29A|nr:PREDICTED: T-lymphoma invasion and metastasis-inducing protein 1-like [Sinocyclocheilus rhinocerous]XP_016364517.1 PREDICTED: T-lymphoma invasion and metastasis-inducing protein 1-like [Sinocyclocheilus rhinocerous]XP_016364518.1 PREDICTED: T-lymphoma invasion and metastasis-inducing protein 1-like [Sinocyclocheilus rhinocerous]XP_016364520.1 PREDICTED: T-lymphoma invasion and metastasis-inducing protein 1-like [Sinocyclocheilus rhinocerous]XP_016364521.1 PREDICTED: T-lymphoma invasion and m